MTEEILLLLVREASKLFFDYVVSESLETGITANANTEATYNTYVSGEMEYVWHSPDLTETRSIPFTISSGMQDLEIMGSPTINPRWLAGIYDADSPTVTVQNTGNDIDIRTTGQMQLYINGNLVNVSSYITQSARMSKTYTAHYGIDSEGVGYFYPQDGIYGRSVIGKLSDISATSNPTISQQFPNAVYVPSPDSGTINYNDYTTSIINWVNNTYPQYNITINDLPTWEELETEDTTEPDYQPASINYDEILSEDELESILTQETYQIPEIETEFFTNPTEILLETGELLGELESIPDFITDSVKSTWDIMNLWGISGLFAGCATVAVIWAIIRGK